MFEFIYLVCIILHNIVQIMALGLLGTLPQGHMSLHRLIQENLSETIMPRAWVYCMWYPPVDLYQICCNCCLAPWLYLHTSVDKKYFFLVWHYKAQHFNILCVLSKSELLLRFSLWHQGQNWSTMEDNDPLKYFDIQMKFGPSAQLQMMNFILVDLDTYPVTCFSQFDIRLQFNII